VGGDFYEEIFEEKSLCNFNPDRQSSQKIVASLGQWHLGEIRGG